MATAQVLVRVMDGPAVLEEALRRPVRLTPSGYAGVAFGGAVYPLLEGDIIDLSSSTWELEDCQRFVLAGTSVPYAPHGGTDPLDHADLPQLDWDLETNQFGYNVVFNASERRAAHVVDALESQGLSVQRWDVSHRQAANGRFYDWFARLRFRGTYDDCREAVAAILDGAHERTPRFRQPTTEEELAARVESLLNELTATQTQLKTAEVAVHQLGKRLESSSDRESRLARDLDRSLGLQRSLIEQLNEARRGPAAEPGLDKLEADLLHTETLLEIALAENASLNEQLRTLNAELVVGAAELADLRSVVDGLNDVVAEMGRVDKERRAAVATRVAPRRGVDGFLGNAFRRLSFVLDGLEVLQSLDSPAAALRVLVQIDMGEQVGRDLVGLRGWREVSKVGTGIPGSEDMGRIYYRPDGDRVLVSVHVKSDDKEQKRHIERLRSV